MRITKAVIRKPKLKKTTAGLRIVMPNTKAAVPKSTEERIGKIVGMKSCANMDKNSPTKNGREKTRILRHLLPMKFINLNLSFTTHRGNKAITLTRDRFDTARLGLVIARD